MNTLSLHNPRPIPLYGKRHYEFIFEDYELAFLKTQLAKIAIDWNNGKGIEQISKEQKRHEVEVLLVLIHLASKERLNRPFAYKVDKNGR